MTQESFENKEEKMAIASEGEKKKPQKTPQTTHKQNQIMSKEDMFGTELLKLICEILSSQTAVLRNCRMFEFWCFSFFFFFLIQ